MIALLALCCWQGCTTSDSDDPQPPQVTNGRVAVDLALSVSTTSGNSGATTRMVADTVQAGGNSGRYRGITNLRAYALNASNAQLGLYTNLTSVPETRHFYTNQIDMSIGTDHFLCYAKANHLANAKPEENGAITASFNDGDYTQNTFAPVGIITSTEQTAIDAAHAKAAAMADYLTSIVTASSSTEWTGSGLYNSIVPKLGAYIAGSSANLKALVTQLNTDLGENPTGAKADVKAKIGDIDEKLYTSDPYPGDIGIPDGAAALQWDGSKFNAVTSFTSETPLSDHRRFIYPPELYYFVDSRIKTATSSLESEYNTKDWSTVLGKYGEADATVSSTTRSVAVSKPLDYAVGCQELYIKANSSQFEDNTEVTNEGDNIVTLTNDRFTLTGILLGGQYQQNYLFEPTVTTSSSDEKIIYDIKIPEGITLNTTVNTTPVYTLSFQTRDEKPVDIVLEFMNNGAKFTGQGGVVHQNTKFYLVGQIWPELDDPIKTDDFYKRSFTKDRKTTVTLIVMSLKHAYNVIPDLKTATYSIKVDNVAVKEWDNGGSQNHEIYNW